MRLIQRGLAGLLSLLLVCGPAAAADNFAITVGSGKTMACKDLSTVCFTQHMLVDHLGNIIDPMPSTGGTVGISGSVAVTGTFWQATQPVSGTFWQTTQPVSIASLPAFAAIPAFKVDHTTPGTTDNFTLPAVTTGGATPYHLVMANTTNSTLISTGAHTLYSLTLTGLNTTAGYLRLYDTAGAPTCSSATGAVHSYLVIGSATTQGGLIVPLPAQGEAYANGLAYCFTGGPTDTDNTSGPAGPILNASYK